MYRGEEMPSFLGVKHRGRLQIVMDVLKAIIEEDKPTRIMYRSNLAWDRMMIALDLLEQRGLISSERMGSRKMSLEGEGYDTRHGCLGEGKPPSCLRATTTQQETSEGSGGSWSEVTAKLTFILHLLTNTRIRIR